MCGCIEFLRHFKLNVMGLATVKLDFSIRKER